MNTKNLLLIATTSLAIAFSGSVFAADAASSDAASSQQADSMKKPKKKKVKPHSHARDEKGVPVSEKSASNDSAASASGESAVKPHNHMRDAK